MTVWLMPGKRTRLRIAMQVGGTRAEEASLLSFYKHTHAYTHTPVFGVVPPLEKYIFPPKVMQCGYCRLGDRDV